MAFKLDKEKKKAVDYIKANSTPEASDATSAAVATAMKITTATMHHRLKCLADEGYIRRARIANKPTGGVKCVWYFVKDHPGARLAMAAQPKKERKPLAPKRKQKPLPEIPAIFLLYQPKIPEVAPGARVIYNDGSTNNPQPSQGGQGNEPSCWRRNGGAFTLHL